jgi:hypothetical protein
MALRVFQMAFVAKKESRSLSLKCSRAAALSARQAILHLAHSSIQALFLFFEQFSI